MCGTVVCYNIVAKSLNTLTSVKAWSVKLRDLHSIDYLVCTHVCMYVCMYVVPVELNLHGVFHTCLSKLDLSQNRLPRMLQQPRCALYAAYGYI